MLLKYKLTYYSIYHFFVFFFTHGIVFKITLQNSKLYEKFSEKILLEQIYIQSREILDWLIESEEYFEYYFGKDNHIIVVEVILWSIEHILGIKVKDNENIFKLIYNININDEKHKKIREIIEKLYKLKKGNLENFNKSILINKKYTKKTNTCNNQLSSETVSNNINQSNYNYNSLQNNYIYNIASSYNSIDNTLLNQENSKILINNEYNKYNANSNPYYPFLFNLPNKQPTTSRVKENNNEIYSILKNKTVLNNKKKNNPSYDKNSKGYINKSIIHNFQSNYDLLKKDIKKNIYYFHEKEKEPIDNCKKKAKPINSDIYQIDIEDIKGKKIYVNDKRKIRKNSLSCSKKNICNSVENTTNNQLNSCFIDANNNQEELNYEEKINKPKIFDNKIKINVNKNLNCISPNQIIYNNKLNKNKKDKETKETLFKKYKQRINEHNIKFINKNSINKNIPKIRIVSTEDLINKTKGIFTVTKINQTVQTEPRDNNKRQFNKLTKKIDKNIINNTINNINKNNTIIINNNIHINTYFNSNKPLVKKQIIIDNIDDKSVSELITSPDLVNKFKGFKKISNSVYDLKNGSKIINKSTTVANSGLKNINQFNFNNTKKF